MATTKGADSRDEGEIPVLPRGTATIRDRIAAFAMLDGMKDATQSAKCLRLSLVGFSNPEIGSMLQISPAAVASATYEERKKVKKPAKKTPAG